MSDPIDIGTDCERCGNPLPANAAFCHRCGAGTGATAPEAVPAAPPLEPKDLGPDTTEDQITGESGAPSETEAPAEEASAGSGPTVHVEPLSAPQPDASDGPAQTAAPAETATGTESAAGERTAEVQAPGVTATAIEPREGTGRRRWLYLVLLLVLVGGGVGAFFLFTGDDDEAADGEATSATEPGGQDDDGGTGDAGDGESEDGGGDTEVDVPVIAAPDEEFGLEISAEHDLDVPLAEIDSTQGELWAVQPDLESGDDSVVVIDPDSVEILATIEIGGFVDSLDADRGTVWVSAAGELVEIDADVRRLVARHNPCGEAEVGEVAAGQQMVWAACDDDTLVRVGTDGSAEETRDRPQGAVSSMDMGEVGVWFALVEDPRVLLMPFDAGEEVVEIDSGHPLRGVEKAGDVIWALGDDETITRVDPAGETAVVTVDVDGVDVAGTEGRSYVVSLSPGAVTRIDTELGDDVPAPEDTEISGHIEVGEQGFSIARLGEQLWVTTTPSTSLFLLTAPA